MTTTTASSLDTPQRNPFPVYSWAGGLTGWRWIDEAGQVSKKLYPTMQDALTATMRHIRDKDPRPVARWKQPVRAIARYLENIAR